MFRNSRLLVAAAPLALAALLLSGCTGGPAQQPTPETVEPLTASKAGGVYLGAVCPLNEAWDEADVEVDRLRISVDRDAGGADTGAFARAMQQIAAASKLAGDELSPKGKSWPEEAEDPIAEVRKTLLADRKQALSVSKLDAVEAAQYVWKGSEEAARAASSARQALGLPEDPVAACEQWRERYPEEKAKTHDVDDAVKGNEAAGSSSGVEKRAKRTDSKKPTGGN